MMRRLTEANELFAERPWTCLDAAERACIGDLRAALADELGVVAASLHRYRPPSPTRPFVPGLLAVASSEAGSMIMLK